jgi:hypothetical protein
MKIRTAVIPARIPGEGFGPGFVATWGAVARVIDAEVSGESCPAVVRLFLDGKLMAQNRGDASNGPIEVRWNETTGPVIGKRIEVEVEVHP